MGSLPPTTMEGSERSILILYGSETGTAQDVAEEVDRLCQRLHFKSQVEELNDVELVSLLQHQLVIFVLSTTGQGDLPHNSLKFWRRLLRKKLPEGCLAPLRYTCFGLGDSTYIKFNWAARKLVRRLENLGATTFMDVCEADEQFPDGIDGTFARWADDLREHLLKHYPPPNGLDPIPDDAILPPKWSLEPALRNIKSNPDTAIINDLSRLSLGRNGSQDEEEAPADGQGNNQPPTETLPLPDGWTATLAENKRLTPPDHWQDVRLASFDIPPREAGSSSSSRALETLQITPGDRLTLYPKNFPADAQKLINLMGWQPIADAPLDLSLCASLPRYLAAPKPCTLRNLLLHNVDITAIPRRSFLRSMSYFTQDEYHRERLVEFTMTEYLDEYYDYATRSRRSIIEVLDEFTSVKIPAERLLDIFPLIRGREFSIAHSSYTNTNTNNDTPNTTPTTSTKVDLLAALVKYRTVLRKPREGLCSRYLATLPPGTLLTITHKPVLSPIHGPLNSLRPLIAIGTGTGIAPIRLLVQERLKHPSPPGPMLIFFGARNRGADYFFEDEWRDLQREAERRGSRIDVFTAFSRDQREKIYVQDVLRRERGRIEGLVGENPIFAVCGGSSKMADACKFAVFGATEEDDKAEEEARMKERLAAVTWWQEIW